MIKKQTLIAGACVVTAGVLGTVAYTQYFNVTEQEVADPYAYESSDSVVSESSVALNEMVEGSVARVFDLKVPDVKEALVKAEVLELPDGRQLIVGWESQMAEPILRSDVNPKEELALINALNTYLPDDAVVFAMPLLSDRLNELASGVYPFAEFAAVQAPRAPQGAEDVVLRLESRWLGESAKADQPEAFVAFIEALTSEDLYGAARLQALTGGEEAYVILHVRDSFDIGVMEPERIHVGLRDFPGGAHAHDITRNVKTWIADEDYAAYAVQQIGEGQILRTYFLADGKDKATLLGQLLPFNTARIGLVDGTKLVFQVGGYWVYRVQPVEPT